PGSLAFENPKKYGYHLLFKTLEEHRVALTQPSWEYFLNYETNWMSRKDLVDTTYLAGKRMALVKSNRNLISEKEKEDTLEKLKFAEEVIQKIRVIVDTSSNASEQQERLRTLENETMETNLEILNKKAELYPDAERGIKIIGAGLLWLKRVLNR
ncbi:MAG: hypothetical protein ACXACA_05720, partial [Candidatus Ranarchaeia archaeon]